MNKTDGIMCVITLALLAFVPLPSHAQTPEDWAELTTLRDAYYAKRDSVIQQNVEAVKSLSVAVDASTVSRHEAELAALKVRIEANRAAAQAALNSLDDPAVTLTLSRLKAILGPMLTELAK